MDRRWIAGALAAAAAVGAGSALAATKLGSPGDSQAVIDDAAKQLGVQPSALSAALTKALANRVDAAVAAGRLTKAQGDELKARIQSAGLPFFLGGGPGRGGFGRHGGELAAAATFLGLTQAELRTQLEAGKTLAQLAAEHGKAAPDLVDALAAAERKELDAAVAAGRLTAAQKDAILAGLTQRLTALVDGTAPRRGPWGGGGHGWRHARP